MMKKKKNINNKITKISNIKNKNKNKFKTKKDNIIEDIIIIK